MSHLYESSDDVDKRRRINMDDDLWLERNNARKTSVLSPVGHQCTSHTAAYTHFIFHFISYTMHLSPSSVRATQIKLQITSGHFAGQHVPQCTSCIELQRSAISRGSKNNVRHRFCRLTLLLPSFPYTCHSTLWKLD